MLIDIGLLVIRLVFGAAIAAHGAQKLFGWFGGYGLKGTGGFFEGLGFRPGRLFAASAGLGEFGGGISLALGLLTPFGATAIFAAMLVAIATVHLKSGFFTSNNGIELPLLYAVSAIAISLTGPGLISLDALFGLTFLSHPFTVATALILSVIGAASTLALRTNPQAQKLATQN